MGRQRFDCNVEKTDIELETKLNKQATKDVSKYFNFMHEGGNEIYRKIEENMRRKEAAEKEKEEKKRKERLLERKIARGRAKHAAKMERRLNRLKAQKDVDNTLRKSKEKVPSVRKHKKLRIITDEK
ncbi:hypothetical protein EDEG_00608 [Edhazardia aedis USNM 41457]|uniref:Uncharacterized protein n=1 Tax=Edhazardia aedis (strain USNM 41457) TaxID=1003232 RepID=J9A0A1_EDHAE|nr:hypothetical protein EDEG_00608 [Edhazardia aedis USNM 41457]|eukprot:EJW05338.1 hypothetical protein EDEG_00608 [Edhazardia aedis USNM 41457]